MKTLEFKNEWYNFQNFNELMKEVKNFDCESKWKDEWYSYDSFEDLMRGLGLL